MAVDTKNILRTDLDKIIKQIKRRTDYRARQDPDAHAQISISGDDMDILYDFFRDAMDDIAAKMSYVKTFDEDALDALADEEGMNTDRPDKVILQVDDLDSMQDKRSVLEGLIAKAIRNYVLEQWYDTVGLYKDAKNHGFEYKDALKTLHKARIRIKKKQNKPKLTYRPF